MVPLQYTWVGGEAMKKSAYWMLILAVIAIGMLHLFTPGRYIFLHDTYRRLSYLPIAMGGIWYGVRGGLFLAAMTSVAFVPHILLFLGRGHQAYLSELTEIVLYLMAGGLIGLIAAKEAKLREGYRALSERLQKSYARLQGQARLLIQTEEQLLASQRLSALGELSASLAHEIKNPLGSIKGSGEILLDEFEEGHPKREFAEILVAEADRLEAAVNKVLKFSPVRRDDGGPETRMTMATVIARTRTLLENHLKKKRIQFRVSLPQGAGTCEVHGEKLIQVLVNILLNAVEAVSTGGKIWMDVADQSAWLIIDISDDGPGIPTQSREQVFIPFYTSKREGTGLGLPISKRIVEGLGGQISVVERDAGGARFTLRIPIQTGVGVDPQAVEGIL